MKADLEALRPWTIGRVAAALELHPFEVVRILCSDGALPPNLRLTPPEMARLVEGGGLEVWWEEDEPLAGSPDELLRRVAAALLERRVIEPAWTRADNVFRGLNAAEQAIVRRAVNGWIRQGLLASRMSERGLEVAVRTGSVDTIRAVAEGRARAYAGSEEDG